MKNCQKQHQHQVYQTAAVNYLVLGAPEKLPGPGANFPVPILQLHSHHFELKNWIYRLGHCL